MIIKPAIPTIVVFTRPDVLQNHVATNPTTIITMPRNARSASKFPIEILLRISQIKLERIFLPQQDEKILFSMRLWLSLLLFIV